MAYDYLGLTNEVLARMNEVVLTATNFTAARGYQIQCQNAVNDAINYINQREFGWPFSHATQSETLVASQTRYTVPTGTQHVDYETFRISKDNTLGVDATTLRVLDYKEYVDKYIGQETSSGVGGVPNFVFRTPDNNYGLYPYPDKAYVLKYEYYSRPTALAAATDVPAVPEQFRQVIADGATAYAYQYRGEAQQYGLNFTRFEEGIKHMQSILLNRTDYVRSTYLPHSQRYGINVAAF
jgi:hypothetical protein|tara:strand:+ start:1278 stop:1994 length:717 start_codon:yes stop_codon:yes gene_type:complete